MTSVLNNLMPTEPLRELDPLIYEAVQEELSRQQSHVELIASENFTLPAVIEAQGTVLTNKYAEGYPAKRYYGGCEFVDKVEQAAIDRARDLFGAEYVNVQPHSGSQANFAVYNAFLKPGDKIVTMSLEHGGHLTHGHPKNFSGNLYDVVHYGVNEDTGLLDYEWLEYLANKEKPAMITVGASAYSREIDFERFGKIARNCGALILADIAHIAGLVAAGEHPSPVGHVDFVTSTTHKTLRGPRGGLILAKEEYGKALNGSVFPGAQGGPLMHVIAGKAICFQEAGKPYFKEYAQQVIKNARAFAGRFIELGYEVPSRGTDNHLFLLDLRKTHPDLTGKQAQIALEQANITCNRNTVPGETRSAFQTSGLRIGTAAITSRGMKKEEMVTIADGIHQILQDTENEESIAAVREKMLKLGEVFPLPY